MPIVRTVCGDVRPDELGVTQVHEHVLSDFSCYLPDDPVDWDRTPLTLGDAYRQRTVAVTHENLTLGRRDEAEVELRRFRSAGGATVVDSTTRGLGRDPEGLRAVSATTGVSVVMGTGWYVAASMPSDFGEWSTAQLADAMESELLDGVATPDGPVRAGLIGEVGLSWPVHPWEERSLAASCVAQRRTGALLQIHPGRHPDAPRTAIRACLELGVDPGRVVMSHIDRTLVTTASMVELARTGCVLEFDLFGQESSYYFDPSFTDMPNDAGRIRSLFALADAGYLEQLAVSQDLCQRTHTAAYGGEGLDHLLLRAVPLMRRLGADEDFVQQLLIRTPARLLAWDPER